MGNQTFQAQLAKDLECMLGGEFSSPVLITHSGQKYPAQTGIFEETTVRWDEGSETDVILPEPMITIVDNLGFLPIEGDLVTVADKDYRVHYARRPGGGEINIYLKKGG